MRISLTVAILLCAVTSFAQTSSSNNSSITSNSTTTSTASTRSTLDKLRDSPFSLRFIEQVSTNYDQESGRMLGLGSNFFITPGYRFNDEWSMNFDNLFSQSYDRASGQVTNQYTYTAINIFRSAILNQKDHGIDISANARLRFYPEFYNKRTTGYFSYTRLGLSASRSFARKFNFSSSIQVAGYQRFTGKDEQNIGYLYPFATLGYSLTERWSLSLTGVYIKTFKTGEGKLTPKGTPIYDSEYSEYSVEVGYTATDRLWLGASVGGYDVAHDSVETLKSMANNTNLVLTAFYSVF